MDTEPAPEPWPRPPLSAVFAFLAAISLSSCATGDPPAESLSVPSDSVVAPSTVREPATVSTVRVLKLESAPVQAFAVVAGTLPSSDSVLEAPRQTLSGQTIEVTLMASRPQPGSGDRTPKPFDTQVPLEIEGLRAGNYYVIVNGTESTLTLARDNTAPVPSTPPVPLAAPLQETPF